MRGTFAWVLGLTLIGVSAAGAQTTLPDGDQDAPKQDAPKQDAPKEAIKGADPAPAMVDGPVNLEAGAAPAPRLYGSLDYLLWWVRRAPTTPLVTTASDTSITAGTLGRGQTFLPQDQAPATILFGNDNGFGFGTFSGVRLELGLHFNDEGTFGFEAGGFLLERKGRTFNATSDANGAPLIARPFFDNFNNREAVYVVSSPGDIAGSITVSSSTQFWGWELNATGRPAWQGASNFGASSFEWLLGFRSLGLDEKLAITEHLAPLPGAVGVLQFNGVEVDSPSTVNTFDQFSARNHFYGGQIGGRFGWQWDRVGATLTAKVALGVTHQQASINGASVLLPDGVVNPGGVLAQPTNIGNYSRNEFSFVPEVGLQFHYDLTASVRVRLGYNVIYWSSVLRPGNQIDRFIDPFQVPTDPNFDRSGAVATQMRPRFAFNDSDFWAHGLNFGIEFRY